MQRCLHGHIDQGASIVDVDGFVKTIDDELLLKERERVVPIEPPVLLIELLDGQLLFYFEVLFLQPTVTEVLQYPKWIKERKPIFNPFPFEGSVLLVEFERQPLHSIRMLIERHVDAIGHVERSWPLDLHVLLQLVLLANIESNQAFTPPVSLTLVVESF